MIRFVVRAFMLLVVVSLAVGLAGSFMKPMPQIPKPSAEQLAAENRDAKDIASRAYVVGKTMSKTGAVKPNAEQLDALSRTAQTQMGDTRSQRWFKQHFEAGFWAGWKSN